MYRTDLLRWLLLAAAALSLCNCGKGESAEAPDQGTTWLLGDWEGLYKSDESASLKEVEAIAAFKGDDAKSGIFKIELPTVEGAACEGTFRDFMAKSIILKIEKSTISGIGAPGASTSFDYELTGAELFLRNSRLELILVRGKGGDDDSTPAKPTDGELGVYGNWACTDSLTNSWRIKIKTDGTFWTSISSAGSSELLHTGAVTAGAGDAYAAILTIKSSSAPDGRYVGSYLKLEQTAVDTILVNFVETMTGKEDVVRDRFSCSRLF